MELTLLGVEGDFGVLTSLKEFSNCRYVFFHIFVMDISVIQVPEGVVNNVGFLVYVVVGESLEGGGGGVFIKPKVMTLSLWGPW